MAMQVGQRGKNLFKEWEGLVTHEYLDSGGPPPSVSAISSPGQSGRRERSASADRPWTIGTASPSSNAGIFALVSFAFNVGDGAFRSSTLLRLLNQGQYDQVPAQLRRWNMDNGHVVQGLINRRNKEIALWNTPV